MCQIGGESEAEERSTGAPIVPKFPVSRSNRTSNTSYLVHYLLACFSHIYLDLFLPMATTKPVKQNGSTHSSSRLDSNTIPQFDDSDDAITEIEGPSSTSVKPRSMKYPSHRINAPGSVQALAVDDDVIFAGTQQGEIVVWSLETYELLATVPAHKESVLSLSLSEDRTLLFSTGADSVVNIWSAESLQRLYSLYSHFEIGDVFCAAHSNKTQTLFWGAQNSSIQWYKFSTDVSFKSPVSAFAPGSRKHRFFDSLGPGGTANPISDDDATSSDLGGRVLTISSRNYLPYAHKSYVYSILLVKGLSTQDKDDEFIITGGGDGTIKIWSIAALPTTVPTQVTKFKIPDFNVLNLSYRGLFLYAGLSDGIAHIYNLASNQLVQKLQVGHGDVSQIAVSAQTILCGTSQGWVKVPPQKC